MRRHCRPLLAGAALLLAAACRPAADDAAHGAETAAASQVAGAEHGHAAGGADSASHDAQTLRAIMQRLDVDMAGFTHALYMEDYPEMVTRSAALANHAHMLPEEVQRIRTTLGADMARFEAADSVVHQAAVRLHEAAQARQIDTVVARLGEVQRGCVSCHGQLRDRLRTDRP